jgi:hypothetical protein
MTSTTDDRAAPLLRVRSPEELLHAVPYLLGFHPAESLVAIGLARGRLVVTTRMDLAELEIPGVLPHVLGAIATGGATALVAVVYSERGDTDEMRLAAHRDLINELADAADDAGLGVDDVLLVRAGRWWSYLCATPECCPAEGRPLASDSSTIPAAATYAGMVALPDRAALERSLAPEPGRERLLDRLRAAEKVAVRAQLTGAAERANRAVKRALFAAAREHDDMAVPLLADDAAVRFGVALRCVAVRDAVWLAAEAGRLDGRPLWQALGRRLPAPYDAAPLFLFGWISWRHGNGALARTAAERALDSDAHYSAADLLLGALARGVDPRRVRKLRMPRSR